MPYTKRTKSGNIDRRGITLEKMADPSFKDPLAPFRWRKGNSGNPAGFSKKGRLSEAIAEELLEKNKSKQTRVGVIASNLLDRAETDSIELERVIRITEPGLLRDGLESQMSLRNNIMVVSRYGGLEETEPQRATDSRTEPITDERSVTKPVGSNKPNGSGGGAAT
jgi:hypothetical protein